MPFSLTVEQASELKPLLEAHDRQRAELQAAKDALGDTEIAIETTLRSAWLTNCNVEIGDLVVARTSEKPDYDYGPFFLTRVEVRRQMNYRTREYDWTVIPKFTIRRKDGSMGINEPGYRERPHDGGSVTVAKVVKP